MDQDPENATKMTERGYIEFADGVVVKGEMVLKFKYAYQAFHIFSYIQFS